MSDINAAMYEIRLNLGRLYGNLEGIELHPDWDQEKVIAAKQVLAIVEQLVEMAKNGN